jgi:hypothetical protein
MEDLTNVYIILVGEHINCPAVDWRIILDWILEKVWEDVDSTHLAHDKGQWRTHVNRAMNLRVP